MTVGPAEYWAEMIDSYRQLIDESGWHQQPMLEFTAWLAGSEYGPVLYPSQSHEALGLSTVATYQERKRVPMVFVVYEEKSGRFDIHYHQPAPVHEVRRETVDSPQAPEVFRGILGWLGLPVGQADA